MADLAARLDGCRVFSKLDLRKGYLQVPVAAEDIAKIAIITPFGLFEFTCMPFGLRNTGMTFQRLMDSGRTSGPSSPSSSRMALSSTWTPAMTSAFQATRGTLSSSAVLAHPAAGAELSLVTDASATHVGAVIQQRHRGQAWRPLGFFSAQLNKAEANYSAFDRELLAVVAAIRHFRYMLEGRKFVIFTDHKPLVGALHRRSDPISARQQRSPLPDRQICPQHSSYHRGVQHCRRHPISPFWQVLSSPLARGGGSHRHSYSQQSRHGGPECNRGKSALRVLGSPCHRRAVLFPAASEFGGIDGSTGRLPGLSARQFVTRTSRVGGDIAWLSSLSGHFFWGVQATGSSRLPPAYF
jgi:hypothetical protein